MKKLFVLLALVLFAFIDKAAGEMNYVTVGDQVYFSDDVKIGSFNVRIATENGLMLKAPLKKVDAVMVDGMLWERMPLICCNGKYMGTALLEFVTQRNDLRLYKYHTDDCNLGCSFLDKSNRESMYFIYKGGKLYLRVDEKNADTVFNFFRIDFKRNG